MTNGSVARWCPGEPAERLRTVIERGGVLAIPTESSYGLAVDPGNREAVNRVFMIKQRASDRPLPIVVANLEQIRELGGLMPEALAPYLATVWPAALTVLLPIAADLPAAAGSGRLGFRIPDHVALRSVLDEIGRGLTATSANQSGAPPLLDPDDVEPLLRDVDAVIVDGGVLPGGLPSTIVDWDDGRLRVLRQGRITVDPSISFSASSVEISVEDAH